MIHLSPAAVSEIRRLKSKQQQQPNPLFRLAVKVGGCSGWYYDIYFDEIIKTGDRTLECDGIQVVIDPESFNYVDGLTIDYSEDLMGGAFRFQNPQANATCGCGNSFAMG